MGISFSSALNFVSSISVPSISIFKQHTVGWGVAALIVGELYARSQLIRSVENSSELFAYKRFEVLTGGALLGLTAYCSNTRFYYGLATIAFFALNRLYRSCTKLPGWERFFKGDWEPYDQTTQSRLFVAQEGFHLLQMLAIFCFYGSNGELSVMHLGQGAIRTGTVCLMSTCLSSMMNLPSVLRYLNSHQDAFLAILKHERFHLCLETLHILAMANLASFSLALGIRGLDIIPLTNGGITLRLLGFFAELGILVGGAIFIPFHFMVRLKWIDHDIFKRVVKQGFLRDLEPSSNNWRLLSNLTAAIWHRTIWLLEEIKSVFTPQVMMERVKLVMRAGAFTDVLSDFAEGSVEAKRTKRIFLHAVFLSNYYITINFTEKYPDVLTPHILFSGKTIWKVLKAEQIERFFLTPELKMLLKEDGLEVISKQVEALSHKISELEKIYSINGSLKNLTEDKWESLFLELRSLYLPLDLFDFTNLLYLLSLLPDSAKAKELVSRLKSHQPSIEGIDSKLKGLEEKLEHLTGDLFKHAYEGLHMLTVADLNLMVQEWGEEMESGPFLKIPFLKIQGLLELKGIRWKGDLITQGILEQGVAPDNSKEALKTRLTNLLHPVS